MTVVSIGVSNASCPGVVKVAEPREVIMEHERRRLAMDRRTFLGAGLAATVAGGTSQAASQVTSSLGKDQHGRDLPYNPRIFAAMPTRNLGRTGHRVGIFSLGGQAMIEYVFVAAMMIASAVNPTMYRLPSKVNG